jgi:flagellar L-ring protein precursor FlgH
MKEEGMNQYSRHFAFLLVLSSFLLTGCIDPDRLARIGKAPPLADIENPLHQQDYEPVSQPMPAPIRAEREPNSLWQAGSRAFFRDQRAARVGDIMTILISIKDSAKLENKTDATQTSTEALNVGNLLGLQTNLDKLLPDGFSSATPGFTDANNSSKSSGDGQIERKEEIEFKVAATVIQLMPNGNMVVKGSQEIVVNREMRRLTVAGIIRPEDISGENSVTYDQIAEARISYGGEGTLSDIQYPRYGQELMNAVMPF